MKGKPSRFALISYLGGAVLAAVMATRLAAASPAIAVDGADVVWTTSLESSPQLVSAAGSVALRVVVEYADASTEALLEQSAALQGAASAVPARIVAEYADAASRLLSVESQPLKEEAACVSGRIIVEYADATLTTGLDPTTPTATPTPSACATATPTPSASVTATPTPTSTPTTDSAAFLGHVTIPQDSSMASGQPFAKVWRLRNNGSTTWTSAYKLVFDGGEQMGAPLEAALPAQVAPGATVDVSVNMTAPSTAGTKRGYWRMKNASGVKFGDRLVIQIVVPFVPSADLSEAIDSLVTNSLRDLDDLDATTLWMAQKGDALRGYIAADGAATVLDLLTGFASMYGDAKDWQTIRKAAWFKPGLDPGQPVGWSHILDLKQNYRTGGLWFDSALGEALRGDRSYAGLGSGLMNYGAKAIAANLRKKGIESVSKYDIEQAARIIASVSDGFTSKVYPLRTDRNLIAMQDLNRTRARLLASFPPMGAALQEAWARDLPKRASASRQLVLAREYSKGSVEAALDLRRRAPAEAVTLFLLKFAATSTARLAFDGAGAFLVNGLVTTFESHQNTIKLSQDLRAYSQAAGFMRRVPDDIDDIHLNAAIALEEIRRRQSPATVLGRIDSVSNFSRGQYRMGLFFSESDSFTDVTLVNTGEEEGMFQVIALYAAHIPLPSWPDVVLGTVAEEKPVTIPPGGRRTISLYYKKGSTGASPVADSSILIIVLGRNAAGGLYLVSSANSTWSSPDRLTERPAGSGGSTSLAAVELPSIDNPLNNYVLASGSPPVYEGQIWVSNVFTQTATAAVTQTLPAGVQLREAANAQVAGSSLVWNFTLPLSATVPVTYTFALSAVPGDAVTVPSPIAYLSDSHGNGFETEGDSLSLTSPLPLLTEAYPPVQVPVGYTATFPITLTNLLSDRSAVGLVTVNMTDTVGNNVHNSVQGFSVAPAATGVLPFALSSLTEPGYYQVAGDLGYQGVGSAIFRHSLLAGSSGPDISMTSAPDGVVRAGQTVTYAVTVTNTTGLTLTDTFITSTVPLSSSVVPGSMTGGGVAGAGTVAWAMPDALPPGQVVTVSFAAEIDSIAIGEDEAFTIRNSALVRSAVAYPAYSAETVVLVLGPSPPIPYHTYLPIVARGYTAGW